MKHCENSENEHDDEDEFLTQMHMDGWQMADR